MRKRGRIGSIERQASHNCEVKHPFERTAQTSRKFAIPTPTAEAFHRLRKVAGAISRLWQDLGGTPNPHTSVNEEHSHRVALFSWRIARFMGLPKEQVERILRGAYLHDVGSVGVPGAMMLKPESLSAEERMAIQVHPRISCELLHAFLSTEDLGEIALAHHERFDGDGYPNGLQGTNIPLEARVLTIADSLDAMLSRRPYRDPLPFSKAMCEITRGAGKQFDPSIVEVFARQGKTLAGFLGAPSGAHAASLAR
jgi:HD-GYP domain-containing protein (c-di-GMP phosphodiesterase class II)